MCVTFWIWTETHSAANAVEVTGNSNGKESMSTSTMSRGAGWAPGSKLLVGFSICRAIGDYVQYNPHFVHGSVFDNPLAWYAAMAAVMGAVYAVMPETRGAQDQTTIGNNIACVASVEVCLQGLGIYCQMQGYEIEVEPAIWRSWLFMDGLAVVVASMVLQRADKEVSSGVRS